MGFSLVITVDNRGQVLDALDEGVQRALEAIGMQCENYAKFKCPVDTGLLRNSITHAVSGKGASAKTYHAQYGSNRNAKGKRISAGSAGAGLVSIGRYSGTIGDEKEAAVYVGSNVEYAAYVEMGTSRRDPQPYLKPAVTEHTDEYKRLAEEAMKW